MERIYRKGVGICLISDKSFETHRIINRSFSGRSVVISAGFRLTQPEAANASNSGVNPCGCPEQTIKPTWS
jgi:hypothetical protein